MCSEINIVSQKNVSLIIAIVLKYQHTNTKMKGNYEYYFLLCSKTYGSEAYFFPFFFLQILENEI